MTSTAPALIEPAALPAIVTPLVEAAQGYARNARADNTRRAYGTAWQDFGTWCEEKGLAALPASPSTVGLYLTDRASTHKVASLRLRLVAIRSAHTLAGLALDTRAREIREVFAGIIRTHGTAPTKKAAAVVEIVRDAARVLDKAQGFRPLRDRALLLVGFAAALRRSELVALDLADVAFGPDGATLTLRRSKTDQDGAGAEIGIPFGRDPLTCPVLALRAWIEAAGIEAGAIFRGVNKAGRIGADRLTDRAVALVVKAAVEAAGYDPTAYSGHSLRSGFITSAARAGVPEAHIQNQSRHRSLPVLRGYIRRGSLFLDNAAGRVGL